MWVFAVFFKIFLGEKRHCSKGFSQLGGKIDLVGLGIEVAGEGQADDFVVRYITQSLHDIIGDFEELVVFFANWISTGILERLAFIPMSAGIEIGTLRKLMNPIIDAIQSEKSKTGKRRLDCSGSSSNPILLLSVFGDVLDEANVSRRGGRSPSLESGKIDGFIKVRKALDFRSSFYFIRGCC